jgi:hypothetical protein
MSTTPRNRSLPNLRPSLPNEDAANNMLEVTAQPVITLQQGDTLRLRVYPWYNGTATGKTICLSDVTIHGMAFDAPSANRCG